MSFLRRFLQAAKLNTGMLQQFNRLGVPHNSAIISGTWHWSARRGRACAPPPPWRPRRCARGAPCAASSRPHAAARLPRRRGPAPSPRPPWPRRHRRPPPSPRPPAPAGPRRRGRGCCGARWRRFARSGRGGAGRTRRGSCCPGRSCGAAPVRAGPRGTPSRPAATR